MGNDQGQQARKCLVLHQKDNTVTALQDLIKGEVLPVLELVGAPLTLRQDIPYAHKFARTFIPRGGDVIKYGEIIGVAILDIQPGEHVHVHNVVGKRAQGGGK